MELTTKAIDTSENIVELTVTGKIRSGNVGDLENEINTLGKNRPVKLILDLQGVASIDSSGMGQLIKARTDIAASGGNIVLLVNSRVEMIIQLSGLYKYFQIASTREEAIKLLNQPPPSNDPPAET